MTPANQNGVSMRAAILESAGKPLSVVSDVAIAAPGPGQVRVKVKNCGVCHSDLSLVDGAFPGPVPIILGHEAAGIVDALGPEVRDLEIGDPVILTPCPPCGTCYFCVRGEASLCVDTIGLLTNAFPDGSTGLSRGEDRVYRGLNVAAFAQYVVTSERGAVRIDADVPLDVACVIGCAVQTGVGAVLNTAGVEEGATVLVMGLGGIGLNVVQGARLAGASRIFASDPVADRRRGREGFRSHRPARPRRPGRRRAHPLGHRRRRRLRVRDRGTLRARPAGNRGDAQRGHDGLRRSASHRPEHRNRPGLALHGERQEVAGVRAR